MSNRLNIVSAFANAFKAINGTGNFKSNIYGNSYPVMKFWDEVHDFPSIYVSSSLENRQYLPGNIIWGLLNLSVRCYVRSDMPNEDLNDLLDDVETVINQSNNIVYNDAGDQAVEVHILQIVTDDGVLVPYGIGEILVRVQYQVS